MPGVCCCCWLWVQPTVRWCRGGLVHVCVSPTPLRSRPPAAPRCVPQHVAAAVPAPRGAAGPQRPRHQGRLLLDSGAGAAGRQVWRTRRRRQAVIRRVRRGLALRPVPLAAAAPHVRRLTEAGHRHPQPLLCAAFAGNRVILILAQALVQVLPPLPALLTQAAAAMLTANSQVGAAWGRVVWDCSSVSANRIARLRRPTSMCCCPRGHTADPCACASRGRRPTAAPPCCPTRRPGAAWRMRLPRWRRDRRCPWRW